MALKKSTTKEKLPVKGKRMAFPANIAPMLATLVDAPVDAKGWTYEIKWDGYRAVAYINNGKVDLKSRNNKSFNEKFYPVFDALKNWPVKAVIDGEVIVADKKGISNFGALQNWRSEADGILQFYVFDLLWYEGKSVMELPLSERRRLLQAILPVSDIIKLSEAFETTATSFFASAKKMGLEGIMAKKEDSLYFPGERSKDWLKIKTQLRQEVVIGGYTLNEDSSKLFSSLLVGVFEKNKLVYTGKIGTGFSHKLQAEMMKKFTPLQTKKNPFTILPDINKPSRFRPDPPKATAVWLKPQLVCEVSFTEMTADGVMRHPSFEGMRIDKTAHTVQLEKETSAKKIIAATKKERSFIKAPVKQAAKTFLNPADETQVRIIAGHEMKFANLHKIFWPKENISKRDMLNYYYQVSPYILPYLKDRPQSLNRFPNGINGMSFYQKDVTGKVPAWIKKYPYVSQGEQKNFMLCNDEATLLFMASLGCIEFNPWSSTIKKPGNPDWCIIDLDPDKNSFNQVIETANVTKQLLDAAGVNCYCKTSGSTGLHIYIPLGTKYTYEQSKEFGRLIAHLVNEQLPKFTSVERMISNRNRKLYIDFLQNRPQATLAAAYSLRPKPGATVSMPLHWEEVKKGLKMTDFTINNAVAKIKEQGDIFNPVLGKGINMQEALKTLSALH